jgi:hypothetical protein
MMQFGGSNPDRSPWYNRSLAEIKANFGKVYQEMKDLSSDIPACYRLRPSDDWEYPPGEIIHSD